MYYFKVNPWHIKYIGIPEKKQYVSFWDEIYNVLDTWCPLIKFVGLQLSDAFHALATVPHNRPLCCTVFRPYFLKRRYRN